MKLATILILIAMAHTSSAWAHSSQTLGASTVATSSEDEIKKLEEARNQAILHGDAAALGRMSTFITLRGEMRTK